MKKIKLLRACVGLAMGSGVALSGCEQAQEPPNILLFIGDDMTWYDCSPYGNPDVYTPNIQRLAEEGMSFDNMFTGTAMCAPTRQQLFSGMHGVRSGAWPNHSIKYEGARSFATHFSEMGYRTGLIGKKHYGPESSYPMTYFGGVHHDTGRGIDIDLSLIENFITGDQDSPYFIVIAQNQPHTPWNRGPRALYDKDELEVPEFLIDCDFTRQELVKYYAEITYMDSLLGVCLDYIDRSGNADNTIVIFTSEQGSNFPFAKWTCYDTGLKTAFIMRWTKKIPAGRRNAQLLHYVDVLPTLIDLAGDEPDAKDTGIPDAVGYTGFDGTSFAGVLKGRKHPREYVYGVQTTKGIYDGPEAYAIRSIRDTRYKLIWNIHYQNKFTNTVTERSNILDLWLEASSTAADSARVAMYQVRPEFEFYDIILDPYELNNQADNADYADIMQNMFAALKEWMASQGDLGHETEMKAMERQVSTP
jgi:N-sulfoglucosamine sulfohydrolase